MAVWYYGDYLNQNNFNVPADVKKFVLYHASDEMKDDVHHDLCKKIMDLVYGAKAFKANYKVREHKLAISEAKVSFTKEADYYVSSEIAITATNVEKLKYALTGTPEGSKIVKGANGGVVIKIPTAAIPEGKKLTFTMEVKGSYTDENPIYYYHSSKYQRLLFGKTIVQNVELKDTITLSISNVTQRYNVKISKTDITQSKEVPGATLVVKDEKGNVIETWVSTTEVHKIVLTPGKYSLTETIAPEGYKLSKTTIEFLLDANGGLFVKDTKGTYVSVDKVSMINELKDSVSIIKRDSKSGKALAGAVLVIKDANGNKVSEFTTTEGYYSIVLNAGQYSVSEVSAPSGYVLSSEVIYFELTSDGILKVKNNKGEYVESAVITFYNTPKDNVEVVVPNTGANNYGILIAGVALILGGIAYARKTIKEC
jgi:LPXTG-motif cell wall-anchored protein